MWLVRWNPSTSMVVWGLRQGLRRGRQEIRGPSIYLSALDISQWHPTLCFKLWGVLVFVGSPSSMLIAFHSTGEPTWIRCDKPLWSSHQVDGILTGTLLLSLCWVPLSFDCHLSDHSPLALLRSSFGRSFMSIFVARVPMTKVTSTAGTQFDTCDNTDQVEEHRS